MSQNFVKLSLRRKIQLLNIILFVYFSWETATAGSDTISSWWSRFADCCDSFAASAADWHPNPGIGILLSFPTVSGSEKLRRIA